MKDLEDLNQFIENLNELPTLSPVALRIVEIANDENSSISEITKLIESDQSLSSKVLQISNYTLMRSEREGEVKTVKHATAILGMDLVRSIALSLIVVKLFETSSESSFNIVEFWRHSAACAIASELFAKSLSFPNPEEAFIAGLLHDLGKIILYQWQTDRYREIVTVANNKKCQILELEEETFEIGHTQVAKRLMEQWKFPKSLIDVAWLHHQPLSEFGSDYLKQLPFIVKCGNSICHVQRFGDSGSYRTDLDKEQLILSTGLSAEDIEQLSSEVLTLFENVAKNYDWKVSTPDLYLSAISRTNKELCDQQLELIEVKQRLTINQQLIKVIYDLLESLSTPVSISQALKIVTETLGSVIPYKKIIGFVPMEQRNTIEGWIKLNNRDNGERIKVPFNLSLSNDLARFKLREQISLIERTIKDLGDQIPSGNIILKALESPDLKVQPMFICENTIGFILIELLPFNWSNHEKNIFLRRYALAAATGLDRLLKHESLNQKTEERAKMARKIDDLQTRLNKFEKQN